MKRQKALSQIVAELKFFFVENGCMTSSAIAIATGINQSQVYRNLYSVPKRITRTHIRLCEYAKIEMQIEASDPRLCDVLMEALGAVWDGSDSHAQRLAALLFAHNRAAVGK